MPADCRGTALLVPVNVAPWLWGWPRRLQARLRAADTELVIIGPWHGERFSRAVDRVEDLEALEDGFGGYVWTNRIDRIGPALRTPRQRQSTGAAGPRSTK